MSEIIMPKMGDAMTEGKVIRWYKKPGDAIKKGEPVLEIETDKVNLDLEAEDDGVLSELSAEAGAVVQVGGVLATIGQGGKESSGKTQEKAAQPPQKKEPPKDTGSTPDKEKAAVKAAATSAESRAEPAASPVAEKKREPVITEGGDSGDASRVKSSPLARKMAQNMGVEITALRGTGPAGRIIAADVEGASKLSSGAGSRSDKPRADKGPLLPPIVPLTAKEIPLTAMRRTIAKRLAESMGPIPHFFLTIDADVTLLSALRIQLNEIQGTKVSINDFVIRAAALSLLHHPNVNASFGADAISQHDQIHIGVAVATAEGLITPVVRNADQRSIAEIAGEVRGLAEKAKNRKLRPEDYQGSTLTISNLGMFGIEEFTAIINPPNAAILAVGASAPRPVVVDGAVVIRDRMKVTMSCDHRVIDGASGAEYLRTFRTYLEQPLRLIV